MTVVTSPKVGCQVTSSSPPAPRRRGPPLPSSLRHTPALPAPVAATPAAGTCVITHVRGDQVQHVVTPKEIDFCNSIVTAEMYSSSRIGEQRAIRAKTAFFGFRRDYFGFFTCRHL